MGLETRSTSHIYKMYFSQISKDVCDVRHNFEKFIYIPPDHENS